MGLILLETEAVAGSYILQGDIHDPLMLEEIKSHLEGKADIVLSDMAAATTGHRPN